MLQKFQKRFLVLEINKFELVVGISLNCEEETCDRP